MKKIVRRIHEVTVTLIVRVINGRLCVAAAWDDGDIIKSNIPTCHPASLIHKHKLWQGKREKFKGYLKKTMKQTVARQCSCQIYTAAHLSAHTTVYKSHKKNITSMQKQNYDPDCLN